MKDRGERIHHHWIVRAKLSLLGFIEDPRYFKRDRTPQIVRNSNERRAVVKFVQKPFLKMSSELKRCDIMYLWTQENIEKGE